MDIKEGKYATMKDGRTIYITKVLESCTERKEAGSERYPQLYDYSYAEDISAVSEALHRSVYKSEVYQE